MIGDPPPPAKTIDLDDLRARTGGDEALLRQVLDLFEKHTLADARRLLETDDATERADLAHKVKGAALGISAAKLAEAAEAVFRRPRAAEALRRFGEAVETVAAALGRGAP